MESVDHLLKIIARLRAPDGCPWDREQTHQSIKPQLIEECYELIEAIENEDDAHLQEELGDVLLHLVFHAQLASERNAFNFDQVANGICEKLIRRHPHVFGQENLPDSERVLARWHELKQREKPERQSALEGIPPQLPALMRSQELQKKAARVGFDWPDTGPVLDKVVEEVQELKAETSLERRKEELGDLFFVLVNLARHWGIDAEEACRQANQKFEKRFRAVEATYQAKGESMQGKPLSELDAVWDQVKHSV
jgi:MazG family protein